MFKFESEEKKYPMVKEGVCQFAIIDVAYQNPDGSPLLSKKGSPMMKLKLMLRDPLNTTQECLDWVLASYPPKIKALCNSIGKPELFKSGGFNPEQLGGQQGKCVVMRREHEGKMYANINEYLPYGYEEPKKEEVASIEEDDIPF